MSNTNDIERIKVLKDVIEITKKQIKKNDKKYEDILNIRNLLFKYLEEYTSEYNTLLNKINSMEK